jgi:ferredoxin-NADP reductase
VISDRELVLRDELDRIAADRGIQLRYVVGDHASPQGRELLSARHLNTLVPDITERDVYLCGPPGMVDGVLNRLRAIGVPRRQLHIERFAL